MEKLIVANWKMNPATLPEALRLAAGISKISKARNVKVVVCAPQPFLQAIALKKPAFQLGAQDAFWENEGPFTGAVSPMMLKSVGAKWIILGHSERRWKMHETDEMVNQKVKAALKLGLRIVLCVGETAQVRRQGTYVSREFVRQQLYDNLRDIPRDFITAKSLVVAYEPVWAISTSKNAHVDDPEDAAHMISFIKTLLAGGSYKLKGQVLYGGSVNAGNARGIFKQKDIDGALVGAASLKPAEFQAVIRMASVSA